MGSSFGGAGPRVGAESWISFHESSFHASSLLLGKAEAPSKKRRARKEEEGRMEFGITILRTSGAVELYDPYGGLFY